MDVLKTGEKLIAKQGDYNSGTIGWFGKGVNDAYDLYLAETITGNLVLIIFMKIQFIFDDYNNNKWNTIEKTSFEKKFKSVINKKWGNMRVLKYLPKGKIVYLDFRFKSWIGGWTVSEHWEIHVSKIKKGNWKGSSVEPLSGYVNLDSEDFTFTNKGYDVQRGAVHEFGHMLGLEDEYEVGSKHEKDYSSIMNSGESILNRHDAPYTAWLNQVLLYNKYI